MKIGNLHLATDQPADHDGDTSEADEDRQRTVEWMQALLSNSEVLRGALAEEATAEFYVRMLTAAFLCSACDLRHLRRGKSCPIAGKMSAVTQFALLAVVRKIADDRMALRGILQQVLESPNGLVLREIEAIEKVLAETGSDTVPAQIEGDAETYLKQSSDYYHGMLERLVSAKAGDV